MKCTIGFDAYIDRIVRIVKQRENEKTCEFYSLIEDFGQKVISMKGLSGDLETVTESVRFGGNAPLMANAMAALSEDVTLVAPVGINSCFDEVRKNLKILNTGNPAESFNIEFNDGKVMLGENCILNEISLENLKKNPNFNEIIKSFNDADLIGFVNWAQMENIPEIYEYILENRENKKQILFCDLADFSKKPKEAIDNFIKTVGKKRENLTVILGLNKNEANLLCDYAKIEKSDCPTEFISKLAEAVNLNIVVHGLDWSALCLYGKTFYKKGKLVEKPVISTGGGDHFNAGFCHALINNMSEEDSLMFAMGTSGAYVSDGVSPSIQRVINYLK